MAEQHPVIAELIAILGEQNVLSQSDELLVYECDGFPIAKGQPTAVVFPSNTDQVSACVKALNHYDLQIVPRGSGTGLAGSAVAYEPGVLITTSRMNQVESLDYENRVAVVQPGVRNLALSDAMADTVGGFLPTRPANVPPQSAATPQPTPAASIPSSTASPPTTSWGSNWFYPMARSPPHAVVPCTTASVPICPG